MSDKKIIAMLREGNETKAFRKLYDHLPKVEEMIRKNSGNRQDALDVFQDALIIFHQKVKNGLQLTASIGTYLYAVCRNLWLEELKRRKKAPSSELNEELVGEAYNAQTADNERKMLLAEKALRSIGKKCRDILIKFYVSKMSMQDIARKLGFSSVNTAKTRKYKCLEQAKKQLRTLTTSESTSVKTS